MAFKRWHILFSLQVALACEPMPLVTAAFAQSVPWPSKPVRVVIPVPPGGSQDTLARAMAADLARLWAQPVLIESRPGAGGVTAAAAVAQSPGDGYTILMTDEMSMTVTPLLHRNLSYDTARDLSGVLALIQASSIVVVPAGSAISSVSDLIAEARARPGAVNYGSWGVGSATHLSTEAFAAQAGISMTHVPYKGGAEVLRALLSNEVQVAFTGLTATIPAIRQGRLKAIAYAGPARAALLPEVPTIGESGVAGFYARGWLGWMVPSSTPRAIVGKIAADAGRVISAPPFREKYVTSVGFEVYNLQTEQFEQMLSGSRARMEVELKRLKLQAE
jgi:tripartite-type tricarboxylate transporter receptor subunit TctC